MQAETEKIERPQEISELYTLLFNAITDAYRYLELGLTDPVDIDLCKHALICLQHAQIRAEDLFLQPRGVEVTTGSTAES